TIKHVLAKIICGTSDGQKWIGGTFRRIGIAGSVARRDLSSGLNRTASGKGSFDPRPEGADKSMV
ncbi:MAG: hypothetical protein P8Y67_12800, partial [Alphaproteobacteria bacterium]